MVIKLVIPGETAPTARARGGSIQIAMALTTAADSTHAGLGQALAGIQWMARGARSLRAAVRKGQAAACSSASEKIVAWATALHAVNRAARRAHSTGGCGSAWEWAVARAMASNWARRAHLPLALAWRRPAKKGCLQAGPQSHA